MKRYLVKFLIDNEMKSAQFHFLGCAKEFADSMVLANIAVEIFVI